MIKKKVLVTGANGYIGRHVVDKLIKLGHDVVATDFVIEGINEKAKLIEGDLFLDMDNAYKRFDKPDVCIHLAWKDGFIHNSDAHMICLSNHYKLIRSLITSGLKDISVMGTMHEIGFYEGEINEETPCNPLSQYGIAKYALRKSVFNLIKDLNSDISLKWLRAFYIFGDDKKNNSIFTKLVKANEEGQSKFPFTSGKNKYDFISVEDLADQIVFASLQDKYNGVINCCSGKAMSLAEKVEEFIEDNKLNIKLEYGVFPDREYDSSIVYGNNDVIKNILIECGGTYAVEK